MTSIDLRPAELDIIGYAGDTIRLTIRTDVDYTTATWTGSVKDSRNVGETSQASFVFGTQTFDAGTSTYVQTAKIEEADTAALFAAANTGNTGQPPVAYSGVWDIQVEHDDPDDVGVLTDVITLLQGTITIESDVTDGT